MHDKIKILSLSLSSLGKNNANYNLFIFFLEDM